MAWVEKYLALNAGANGDGSAASPWNSWPNAISGLGTIAAPTRLNVRGNGSLANTLSFYIPGTGFTTPLWVRGCDASWNDIRDSQAGQPTTNQLTFPISLVNTGHVLFTGLVFTGAPTTALWAQTSSGYQWFRRCTFINTNSSANASAFTSSAASLVFEHCQFIGSSAGTSQVVGISGGSMFGCVLRGSVDRCLSLNASATVIKCVFDGFMGSGVQSNGGAHVILGNSFFASGGAANQRVINLMASPNYHFIANNVIAGASGPGGCGIYTSAASGLNARLMNNRFYNCETRISGILENLQLGPDDGSSSLPVSPFTNPAGHDFVPTSVICNGASPGRFQGESYSSYDDCGAVRHQDPAAGGFRFPHPRTLGA